MEDATEQGKPRGKGFWAGEWEHLQPIVAHFLKALLFDLCVGVLHFIGKVILPLQMLHFVDEIEYWVVVTTVILFALWFIIFLSMRLMSSLVVEYDQLFGKRK